MDAGTSPLPATSSKERFPNKEGFIHDFSQDFKTMFFFLKNLQIGTTALPNPT